VASTISTISLRGAGRFGAIGIADENSGEVVKIVVVRRNNPVTERELIDFCRTRIAGYKIPKLVEFRSEMPKTNVGKILRRALK
jgi:long-chain acyl-CoA synthetase